jgi:hypothetical protein
MGLQGTPGKQVWVGLFLFHQHSTLNIYN